MIPVLNLLMDLDTKLNRLANLRGQFIPNETKIDLLNKAQIKLVLKKLGINNNYQLGMDSFTKRYQDLQILQVPYEKMTLTATTSGPTGWQCPISGLSNQMIVPVDAYITATRGNCKDRILDVIEIVKHADVRFKLISPHYKPSFKYQETLASISSDTIYVYGEDSVKATDKFTATGLYLSYLRYPVNVGLAGIINLDGSVQTTVNCELEAYLEDELAELAVEEIADATANQEVSQLSRVREKEDE